MTPERRKQIKVAIERMLAAEHKRVASLPETLAELNREAPSWPIADMMAEHERARSK